MDRTDRKILRELQLDAKQSNANLAERVGLSESACLRRVRLLEQAGVIERYTAVGMTVGFIIRITLKSQTDRDLSAFEQAIRGVPEVAECDLTTGESDYVLRVVARDSADFERVHSKVLTKLPGVSRVDSSFVLRSVVKNAGVPIEP
jgi:Lrp/AsnC family transcriptional regulator, leucine-responsive regulatory protein